MRSKLPALLELVSVGLLNYLVEKEVLPFFRGGAGTRTGTQISCGSPRHGPYAATASDAAGRSSNRRCRSSVFAVHVSREVLGALP